MSTLRRVTCKTCGETANWADEFGAAFAEPLCKCDTSTGGRAMALADYYLCDVCEGKAIYDADWYDRWMPGPKGEPNDQSITGSITIICKRCGEKGYSTGVVHPWTTESPTEPGWYWWREHSEANPKVLEVIHEDGLLRLNFGTRPLANRGEWAPVQEPPP